MQMSDAAILAWSAAVPAAITAIGVVITAIFSGLAAVRAGRTQAAQKDAAVVQFQLLENTNGSLHHARAMEAKMIEKVERLEARLAELTAQKHEAEIAEAKEESQP